MKKMLQILTGGFLLSSMLYTQAFAETSGTWDNGELGSGTWSIEDGKLIISGTGETPNYHHDWSDGFTVDTPWFPEKASITSVEVKNGITSIGNNLLAGLPSTSATIAKSVEKIGSHSFYNSSLNNINYEEGSKLNYIGTHAFRMSDMQKIFVPDSVIYIANLGRESTLRQYYCTTAQIQNAGCTAENLNTDQNKIFTYEKSANHYNIYDANGKIVAQYAKIADFGTENQWNPRRIYTIEEATEALGKANRNTFSIRYR